MKVAQPNFTRASKTTESESSMGKKARSTLVPEFLNLNDALRALISTIISDAAANQPAWWYRLSDHKYHETTCLSELLGLPKEIMPSVLYHIGIAHVHGKHLCVSETKLCDFLEYSCDGLLSSQQAEVNKTQLNKKDGWFLCVGSFKKGHSAFNAKRQAYFTPNEVSKLSPLFSDVTTSQNAKLLQATLFMMLQTNQLMDPYCITPNPHTKKQAVAQHIKAKEANKDEHNITAIQKAALETANAAPQRFKTSDSLNQNDFPVLESFGIDIHDKTIISRLLRDIWKLKTKVDDEKDPFTFLAYNDKPITLVQIPRSTGCDSFKKQARQKKWIEKVLTAMTPLPNISTNNNGNNQPLGETENDDSDNDAPAVSQQAVWILTHIGNEFQDEFVEAATRLCMPVFGNAEMDAVSASAMWTKANVSVKSQRVINRHMLAFLGKRVIVPEAEIQKLSADAFEPAACNIEHDGVQVHFTYKELDHLIEHYVGAHYNAASSRIYSRADIVVGGDNGQSAFQATVKVVLCNHDNPNKKESVELVHQFGEIECKKESASLLKQTLIPPLNESVCRMKRQDDGQTDDDGSLTVYKDTASGKVYATFGGLRRSESDAFVANIPFSFKVTGDLASYGMLQGTKEHSSSHWCPFCQLSHAAWQAKDHDQGTLWTYDSLKQVGLDVIEKKVSLPSEKKGVVEPPLLEGIEPSHYVCPVLHLELGMGNRLYYQLLDYIDARLAIIKPTARKAQEEYFAALSCHDAATSNLTNWAAGDGAALVQHRADIKKLVALQKQPVYTKAEKKEIQEVIKALRDKQSKLEQVKKDLLMKKANAQRELKLKKQEWVRQSKEYVRGRKFIQTAIEEKYMIPNGVTRAAYHGGELTGNSVRAFMAKAPDIIAGLNEYISNLSQQDNRNWSEQQIQEMRRHCEVTCDCLVLFDGLFSLLQETPETINDKKIAKAEVFLTKAMSAWQALGLSITVKAHILEDHCIEQMKFFKGLGDYSEDFVEQQHQEGVKDQNRSKGFRDRRKKWIHKARWEHLKQNEEVKARVVEVRQRAKRKKSDAKGDNNNLLPIKAQKRQRTLETYTPPNPNPLPSLEALNRRDYEATRLMD